MFVHFSHTEYAQPLIVSEVILWTDNLNSSVLQESFGVENIPADWKHLFLSLRNVSFDGKKSLSVDHTEFIMVWTQRMRLVGECFH